ncbi:MAG: hypothetical protein IJ111_15335 [Eggerthellaceae bacterium]|nr:hypothetical protein [Eggerthellaceae bacterium]MBQ9044176.1 hypothetical protein [Eggerthellaceae bacterium]
MKCVNRLTAVITVLVLAFALPFAAFADEQVGNGSSDNKYYYGEKVNTGLDNGYSEANPIKDNDPHFGWDLGRFVITGFSSKAGDNGMPIFLKNKGDQVQLTFVLDQDISALNGDDSKKISDDKDGKDQQFEIPRSEDGFGHGTLIVRHTDFQNSSTDPQIYRDYLPALVVGAETTVDLCEEGDYEVALDYEVESPGMLPFRPAYNNYRIAFQFKVRNSNTMMFLFDTKTNDELFNGSVTPNGFRIDLAGSHYLDVSVKKDVMNETRDGLVEDTRFNRTANDGDRFEEEGIYTIKVKNPSTSEEPTEKRIYVGTDDVMKAAVANNIDVADAQKRIQGGEAVDDNGKFVQASLKQEGNGSSSSSVSSSSAAANENGGKTENGGNGLPIAPIAVGIIVVAAIAMLLFSRSRKRMPIESASSPIAEEFKAQDDQQVDEAKGGDRQ